MDLDTHQYQWERAMRKLPLGKNSLLLHRRTASSLIEKYEIKELPRFMLLDGEGFVLSENAPAPDTVEIREVLNEIAC